MDYQKTPPYDKDKPEEQNTVQNSDNSENLDGIVQNSKIEGRVLEGRVLYGRKLEGRKLYSGKPPENNS